jgi:hypothetical protein
MALAASSSRGRIRRTAIEPPTPTAASTPRSAAIRSGEDVVGIFPERSAARASRADVNRSSTAGSSILRSQATRGGDSGIHEGISTRSFFVGSSAGCFAVASASTVAPSE